ncbi:MAG: fatty acid desaturase [Saprospiraceae bacterium]|nr:fatty acid desaturase [Saprospiraceae bacterium]
MLRGKDLILATKKYAVEIRRESWFHLGITLLLFVVTYTGAILPSGPLVQLPFSILAGLMSVRFFIIYHDYLHKSILQDSLLARIIFTGFGLFILAPVSIWKRSHDYHHAHNSKLYTTSIGSYPVVTKKEFLAANRTERNIYLFIRHPLTITFGYVFVFLWGMCLRTLIRSGLKKHVDCLFALIFHFGLGFLIWYLFGFFSFILGFLLPAMISNALGAYLFYAQHNFPGVIFRKKDEWSYTDAALLSSSFMHMNQFMHWCTGNIGYHHIHHLNARIPFYKLPQVYHDIPELQKPRSTSLAPKDILACLRLKVWDPDTQKMVGMKEIMQKQ